MNHLKPYGIRLRLTLWYAGSILVLLLVMTFIARSVVRDTMEREFDHSLHTSATLVQGFFRLEISEYQEVIPTLDHISGELVIGDRHIHFVHPDSRLFEPGPEVKMMPLPELVPPIKRLQVPLDSVLAPGWGLLITASAASVVRQERRLDNWALLGIPFAMAVALLVGWVLTGRTLRPVAAMVKAADQITGLDATGRLPIAVPHDELGQLGTRFNALLDRLDAALAHQRRFLADAAHELRTPIARARGAGELALSAPEAAPSDREALVRSQRELEAMSHLVDELLVLARSDADGKPLPLKKGFLDDVVTDVAHGFEPLARGRDVALEVVVPEEAPILMEEYALRRLVSILLDNAIRYSNNGGRVEVRVEVGDGSARLHITDDGIGIRAEERGRLFERFFRGAQARQKAPEGSGLGLAIAMSIAERHGAAISFEPPTGSGTHVKVTFRSS